MQSRELLASILADCLKALGLAQPRRYAGRPAWHVTLHASGSGLDIEYDESMNRVMLSADLGPIAHDDRAPIHEALLQYNFIWTQTGGVRMALDGTAGHVVALFEVAMTELDTARLAALVENMAGLQDTWTQILGGGPPPASLREPAMPAQVQRAGLRV